VGRVDRWIRLQIVWAGVRWRLGASLIMLTVATVGIAAASFGPVFLRGGDSSVLRSTLRAADASDVGLSLLAVNDHVTPKELHRAAMSVPRAPGGAAVYGSMIVTASVAIDPVAVGRTQPYVADLVSRTGMCRHLTFIVGSCPHGPGTVALSQRSARTLHLRVGDRARLACPPITTPGRSWCRGCSVRATLRHRSGGVRTTSALVKHPPLVPASTISLPPAGRC
jgi:hypothetical protein